MLPSRVVSKKLRVIAELIPDSIHKRYEIAIRCGVSNEELTKAGDGTVGREGRYSEAFLTHTVNGKRYKTKITTLRGDVREASGSVVNQLRPWRRTTSGHMPTTFFKSGSTAFSGCDRNEERIAGSTNFAQ